VTRVMQNLLEECISIRDVRSIVEALAEFGGKGQDTDAITGKVRVALGRTIFQMVNGVGHEMPVMTIDSQLEQILQGALQGIPGGLEPALIESVINQIIEASGKIEAEGKTAVALVASNIRPFLFKLLSSRMDKFYILAYEEIPADKSIKVVATIGSGQQLL